MTYPAETYEKTFTGQEPFIAQHRSAGTGLLPAAVQLEMAMVGVARRGPFAPLELTDVTFLRPLTISEGAAAPVRLDVTFGPRTRFELSTVVAGERKPLSTGTGRLLPDAFQAPPAGPGPQPAGPLTLAPSRLYDSWAREGLQYGPDFRTVQELAVGDGGVVRATLRSDAEPVPWYAHPLLVDGVFQVVSCALQDLTGSDGPHPMLPIGLARLRVLTDLSALSSGVTVLVRRTGVDGAYATADATVLGPSNEIAAEFEGLRMRRTAAVGGGPPPRPRHDPPRCPSAGSSGVPHPRTPPAARAGDRHLGGAARRRHRRARRAHRRAAAGRGRPRGGGRYRPLRAAAP